MRWNEQVKRCEIKVDGEERVLCEVERGAKRALVFSVTSRQEDGSHVVQWRSAAILLICAC